MQKDTKKKIYQKITSTSLQQGDIPQKAVKSIKAKADAKRSVLDKLADKMNTIFGSNGFLYSNILIFIVWIVTNTGGIPGVAAFDPFPFSLLTTAISIEAIILSIFVLMSQNRSAKVANLREELQLQINVLTEEEITKIMKMLVLLLKKNKIKIPEDENIHKMLHETDTQKMEQKIKRQLES